jgi:Ca2+-transporting ATPase
MFEKPRPKDENFFAQNLGLHIGLEGVVVGALTLTSYILGFTLYSHAVATTMTFITLAFTQLFHSYNVKSEKSVLGKQTFNTRFLNLAFVVGAVLQLAVVYIPGLNSVFQSVALTLPQIGIALACAFTIVIVMEVYKLAVKIFNKIKK